jgi:RNA polymerase sigma-70 factor (ECF subfamily)
LSGDSLDDLGLRYGPHGIDDRIGVFLLLRVDDIEIIRSFQDGNLGAFDEVVAEFRDPLVRHALRRLHDPGAAEDAVQETFVRAYRSFDRLHEASRIGPWLHHILANVCIDEANRRTRDADKNERALADPFGRQTTPGVEQQLGLDADMSCLDDAMGTLPDAYKEALLLRFVDELSYEEMAVAAETTEQNVRARVSRARTAMKIALRGVAMFPALVAGVMLRRGVRSTALAEKAAERADTTHKLASTAESGVMVSKLASHMAPAVEMVNTLTISAQTSAPALSKAAIGIGAIALAAVSANPERSSVIPPAPPAVVMQVEQDLNAGSAASDTPLTPAQSGAPRDTASEGSGSLGVAALLDQTTDAGDADTGSAESTEADDATNGTGSTSNGESAGSGSTPAPPTVEDEAPISLPGPVLLAGGTATAVSVTFTEAGARTDLSGQLRLEVNGVTSVVAFTGRWSIDSETDRTGGYRLSGVLTVMIGTTPVELRLAGHVAKATETDSSDASTRTFSGLFRAVNGDAAGLVDSGTFSGSFGPGSLVARLAP